jgi:hypothetical protein
MGKLFKQKELINKHKILENKRINKGNEDINLLDFDNLILDKNQFERFDTYSGLFNTQQLLGSIDFSEFRNHCFFDSAVSKVEYTFNKIYDDFPLDGSELEVNQYLRSFDGFGKFIYNQIDKNIGYLKFNNNGYIEVTNKSGYLFSLNRNENIISKLTKPILNPKNDEFSIDFRIFLQNNIEYNNNPVFQYLDNKIIAGVSSQNGFTFFIKNNVLNSLLTEVVFILTDGLNNKKAFCSFQILRNKWNHISLSIKNVLNKKNIIVYIDGVEIEVNNGESDILSNSSLDISNNTKFYIGKAISNHIISNNNNYNFQINNTKFIGLLDEFRFYHKSLTNEEIILKKEKNEFANDSLKLYFRFNEPAGVYGNNSICFDYSGNSLHSRIVTEGTTVDNLRYDPTNDLIKPSLKFENDDFNPILFPSFQKNKDLNEVYLNKAKEWDIFNSNLIFKLFPRHYFDEGAEFEGLNESFNNDAAKTYYITDDDLPGQQKVEAIQTFANLLIIWARFFDEIKLYLDIMPKLIDIDYEDINSKESIVNFFLPLMTKRNGFIFKELLNNNTNKILDGYIIGTDGVDKSQYNMRYIQNQIWKRILVNSKDMIMSKGTLQSIKSIFNSVGINYDEYYKFREYGKSLNTFIEKSYLKKNKDFKIINFNQTNKNLVLKSKLNNLNNFFNEKSYTFEFFLHYINYLQQKKLTESIFKLVNTDLNNELLLELFFDKNSETIYGDLILSLKNSDNTISEYIRLENLNIFDNNLQISIHIENIDNEIIMSLVCQTCEKDAEYFRKDYKFKKTNQVLPKIFQISEDILEINIGNNISFRNIFEFNGNISNIKLWNTNLSKNDINMHAMNQFSISNDEYKLNKNLNKKLSDFLLLHLSCQDDVYNKELSSENINLIDFSELTTDDLNSNNYPHKLICSNPILSSSDRIVNKQIIIYENDIKFDEYNFENKVKIMGFNDIDLAEEYNTEISPVYTTNYFNQQKNDVRFSIEMSNVKHLNEDISKLFNDTSFLKNIISEFSAINDTYYNNIEKFSDFYFKRIKSDKIQITPLYEIYQILDNVLTEMLSDFISTRVKFNNNIYVIESHILERHKFNYKFMESHILMKGDYSIQSPSNTRKSMNYLNAPGRKL